VTAPLEIHLTDPRDLVAKMEAGHIIEWSEYSMKDARTYYFVCQKRGAEYVKVIGTSEEGARKNWQLAMQRGYYQDDQGRRVSIPGAR
jgi:hypothetical protein